MARPVNRREKRDEYDAAERRQRDDDEFDDEDEEIDDELDEEDGEEEDDEGDEENTDEDSDEDADEGIKKKKAAAKAKTGRKTRSKSSKSARMKMVWGVFNNSNVRVAVFDYPKRKEAQELATKLTADKKSTHFVQPVREPMEEQKEKEAEKEAKTPKPRAKKK
ncbi:MAG: hypothetical protein KatS3mg105_4698 [Gemmatales bacterium]|nr:MAG: hypothetical protein KatS3mg105_4698 [Gemmatales bacterium]